MAITPRSVPEGKRHLAASAGARAVELSEQDAQNILEVTGIPPENPEDQDLREAMAELKIQSEPVTPEDEAALAG